MPASSFDPIASSLHASIESSKREYSSENLDSLISISAKRILLHPVDFKETGTQNSVLTNPLKSKYIVLKTTNNCSNQVNGDDGHRKSLDSKSNGSSNGSSSQDTLPQPKHVIFPPENIKLGWTGKEPIGSGFSNLGNTCYLNSTLQALFHVPAFVNWLNYDKQHFNLCQQKNGLLHNDCMVCALHETLVSSQKNTGNSIRPVHITGKLKSICKHFQFGHQEDAHEFLRYLIESLEKSYLAPLQPIKLDNYSRETTPLNQIFGGYIRTEVTCLECGHVSTTFQHFQDLLLDIRQASTIDDALENYFSKERLDEDNAYRCEHCRRKVSAHKKFSIEKPPNVLCLQLKRFNSLGGKNTRGITINQCLDLSKFRHKGLFNSQRLKYKIASIILHYGTSTSCGHYTALAYSAQRTPHTFDDSQVHPSAYSSVSSNAYVMMYELDQPTPISRTTKSITISNTNVYSNGLSVKQENSTSVHRPIPSSVSSSLSSSPSPNLERPESEKKSWKQGKVYISNGGEHPQPTPPASSTNTPTTTSSSSSTSSKSLVPYMSDSGSDSDDSVKCRTNGNLTNGFGSAPGKCLPRISFNSTPAFASKVSTVNNSSGCAKTTQASSLNPSQETVTTRVTECSVSNSVQSNGWLITDSPVKSKLSVCSTEKSVERGVGHWSVTEAKHSESMNDQSHTNGSSNHCWRKPFPPLENGHSNHLSSSNSKNSNNSSNGNASNSLSNCNGSSKSSVLSHLNNSSHLGYGNNVNSWNGCQSQVNRDAERDRFESKKRSYDQSYNDEIDRGKVKKVKYNHNFKSEYTNGNGKDNFRYQKPQQRNSYNKNWGRSQYHNYNKPNHNNKFRYNSQYNKHNNGRNNNHRDNFWRRK